MRRRLFGGVMVLGLAGFAGCSTLGYYLQAFNGQMELTRKARPIPQVLDDERTPAELKARLERVQEIRAFASQDLALPDNGSYRRYADLQRPFVVWNVFATEEFSVVPAQWCFPIAGCVGYRGYFAQDAADAFAAQQRDAGPGRLCGGRAGLFDAGMDGRPGAEHLHPLSGHRDRAPGFPRAGAPARLCPRGQHVQ